MRVLCTILLLFLSGLALAQHPYSYSFNERHGFPINEVYYLYQDKKGNIWIGCNDGIFRYNGIALKQFTHPKRNSRGISHILEDRYGRIWSQNFTGQIFRIEADSMHLAFDAAKYSLVNPPYDIDNDGNLYIAGQRAFYVMNNEGKVRKISLPGNTWLSELFHARDGSILILSDKLYKWKNDKLAVISKTNSPAVLRTFGSGGAKFEYMGDKLLLYTEVNATRKYYLSTIIGDSIAITTIPDSLTQGRIYNLALLRDGKIWINTKNGNICVDSNMHPVFGSRFFFPGSNVSDIIMDVEGNYWVSTLESGIHIIPNIGIWQYTHENSKLSDNNVTSLYVDSSGLYIGYFNGVVDRVKSGSFERKLFSSSNKYQLVEKIDKHPQSGTLHISHGRMSTYDPRTNACHDFRNMSGMKDFVFAGNNTLFAANIGAGMFAARNGNDDTLWMIRRSPSRCVAYDSTHKLKWVGFTDGTYYFDTVGRMKELLHNGSKVYAVCMKESGEGILWMGTVNGSLLKVKDEKIIDAFSEQKGLHGKNVRVIYQSGKQLWVATEKALNIIDIVTGKVSYIDTHDGLPTMDINDIVVNDNIVYLATTKGLFVFSQYIKNINDGRPEIIINKLLVNDKEYPADKPLALDSRQNKLTVYFGTASIGEKYEYNYRYKLDGYDTAWQQTPQNVNYVNYSFLPPGSYTFYAKTVNEDGFESAKQYTINISISKPFWQRWWFYILIGVAGAFVVSVIFLARIRAIKHKSKLQQLIRSSQLTALKAQMNPHFVFNALNSIQDFVLSNDIKNANLYLGRFSELMRKVLEASGKESIPLQQEIDILALYLDLEKLRFGRRFVYSLEIDRGIDASAIYIPSMIIQPFIENAIKHGLLHKEGEKRLVVRFEQQGSVATDIVCIITDNGIGRKRAMEIGQRGRGVPTNGFAIKATEKRLDLLNSYHKEKIGLEITDLSDAGGALGTRVKLVIPCSIEPVHEPV